MSSDATSRGRLTHRTRLMKLGRAGFSKEFEKVIVTIHLNREDFVYFDGHGVLISDNGWIATVYHLFDSEDPNSSFQVGSEVGIKWFDGESFKIYYAEIVLLVKQNDVALLRVVRSKGEEDMPWNFNYANFADELPKLGQEVHMIATNDGVNFEYTCGMISFEGRKCGDVPPRCRDLIHFIGEDSPVIQVHNLHGIPGCSGVPVLNSEGEVVGLYSFGHARMAFLTPSTILKALCALHLKESGECGMVEEEDKESGDSGMVEEEDKESGECGMVEEEDKILSRKRKRKLHPFLSKFSFKLTHNLMIRGRAKASTPEN
ncbi:hypothetical protein DM860_009622 [Cuscuta australis]|uniref:Peptidase S1 domain-containing protein n=1 Tax=Cuscuta australis TaxID=267555 RepID=A0A328DM88_9ASTE|nr:hypothetical protein DM860_009622 [Cuscuta australis]